MTKRFSILFTILLSLFISQGLSAQNMSFKISSTTIDFLKGDLENLLSDSAYEILEDNLLGTVLDLEAGENFTVSEDEWKTTLNALINIDYVFFEFEDTRVKVRQAKEAAQLTAISSQHEVDKNNNERFLVKLAEVLQEWLNSSEG